MYILLFLSDLAFIAIFASSFYFGTEEWVNDGFIKLLVAFLIINSFTLFVLNVYTFHLVCKFGCCFVEGLDEEMNAKKQNNGRRFSQVNIC